MPWRQDEWCPVEAGVRQGCTWAFHFIIIAMEPPAQAIRAIQNVGYQINGSSRLLVDLYADNLGLLLSRPSKWPPVRDMITQLGSVSGLRLNTTKTELHEPRGDGEAWSAALQPVRILQTT